MSIELWQLALLLLVTFIGGILTGVFLAAFCNMAGEQDRQHWMEEGE